MPDYGAVPVNDEHIGISVVLARIVNLVRFDHFRWLIVQHREVQTQPFYGEAGLGKLIHANGEDLSVQSGKSVVVILQLNELRTAEGSPEATVEHQDHILVPSIRLQADLGTVQSARQCKQGRHILRRSRFRGGSSGGSGLGRGR